MPESIAGYIPLTEAEQRLSHQEIARRSGLFRQVELVQIEGSDNLYRAEDGSQKVGHFESGSGIQRMQVYREEDLSELMATDRKHE